MSRLEITGLSKGFGRVSALEGVDLTVPNGTLLAVLGPSGCGKTTLLRCVAGFERPDAGVITIDGRVVASGSSHTPPHRRGIAIVPQEGALFPHLSVRGNVAYGLGRADRRGKRVDEVLEMVGLAGKGDRMPHQLSGGQQQRVALARALAPRPSLILFDEPFSALDAGLRTDLRRDVRAALRAADATGVLVTHDQSEALSTADAIAVMRDGSIVQLGEPADVYRAPADPWVATFLGEAILLEATVEDGRAETPLGTVEVTNPLPGRALLMIRPEQIAPGPGPATHTPAKALVEDLEFYGPHTMLTLRLADGTRALAQTPGTLDLPPGTTTPVHVTGQAHTFPLPP
ncbi:ABC transporter ATP-binding protein [Actinocorallia sp. A-T 12471]|uniref:ABC transporter ATP-binding protein n=1 Tax=Actinocorallia sp. A-T 12471 TaxID=3089813 RepID=UPI0029D0B19D|nr:ABC transporter ATP-binding protein [Actinocorallia sp. A-T 12471]MDX6740685.1 ABC transporter ATP-binding protein [Actinocorallia sp. A-T 12471]